MILKTFNVYAYERVSQGGRGAWGIEWMMLIFTFIIYEG